MDETTSAGIVCQDVVELLTEYLEGVLPPPRHWAVHEHLRECAPCADYLAQLRATIAATGELRSQSLSPATRAGLVSAFRDLLGNRPPS